MESQESSRPQPITRGASGWWQRQCPIIDQSELLHLCDGRGIAEGGCSYSNGSRGISERGCSCSTLVLGCLLSRVVSLHLCSGVGVPLEVGGVAITLCGCWGTSGAGRWPVWGQGAPPASCSVRPGPSSPAATQKVHIHIHSLTLESKFFLFGTSPHTGPSQGAKQKMITIQQTAELTNILIIL